MPTNTWYHLGAELPEQAERQAFQAGKVQLQGRRAIAGSVCRVLALHDGRPLVHKARQLTAALQQHLCRAGGSAIYHSNAGPCGSSCAFQCSFALLISKHPVSASGRLRSMSAPAGD